MRLACERVVREILPAVRSTVARELFERGYSQTEIADLMDITQPAVSQYLNAARGTNGHDVVEDPEIEGKMDELIGKMTNGAAESELSSLLCDICTKAGNVEGEENARICNH